jgi:hypothetical protein
MKINTSNINQTINSDFTSAYRNATPFINSGQLWNFCMDVLSDPMLIQCIIFANDLEIPPVKSLMHLYRLKFTPSNTFKFSQQQSQWLGALMGFLFKNILGYKSQKERVQVNMLGVGTATRYLDGPSNIVIK